MKKLLLLLLILPLFIACGDDDNSITLKEVEKTLKYGETYQIDATSSKKISYVSENEYHATVSESGLVTAGRIGETEIVLTDGSDRKKFRVTINPESTMYPDPNLEFGISKADLIKKLGAPSREILEGISYSNFSTKVPIVTYHFDSNNKLESVGIVLETVYSSELITHLGERYVYLDPNRIFINALEPKEATMLIVAYMYNKGYWMAIYMPYPNAEAKSQKASVMDRITKVAGIN